MSTSALPHRCRFERVTLPEALLLTFAQDLWPNLAACRTLAGHYARRLRAGDEHGACNLLGGLVCRAGQLSATIRDWRGLAGVEQLRGDPFYLALLRAAERLGANTDERHLAAFAEAREQLATVALTWG